MAKREVTVPKSDKIVVEFEFEYETKNMSRFSELVDDWSQHLIGKLYIHKAAFSALGEPSKLTVTLTKPK